MSHDEKNMCPLELSLSEYRGIKVSTFFCTAAMYEHTVGSKVRTFLFGWTSVLFTVTSSGTQHVATFDWRQTGLLN